jgi:hypothetical protein
MEPLKLPDARCDRLVRGLIQRMQTSGIERRRGLAAVPRGAKVQYGKQESQEADACEYGNSNEYYGERCHLSVALRL